MNGLRKPNGEGSIIKVNDNKWIAKISLGTGADGKPIIKQFSGKTEAIVKKKLRDFKKSDKKGTHPDMVVRVCGYSAVFGQLPADMQDEIISRAEGKQ